MKTLFGRSALVAAVCGATLATGAGAALAHIEPDPPAIEAGASTTVGFGVEHGCDGSPTTQLAFKVPAGITDAQPVEKQGWTAAVADGVVTFSGGNLDPATPDTFSLTFTAPATAGTIYFPVVQTCVAGDLAWIEIPADGAAEPESPAPAVKVTDGPPTSADLAPAHDDDDATAGTDHHAEDTAATAATIGSTESSGVTVTTASSDDSDDSSNTGLVVGIIVGVVVVGGVGGAVFARRKKSV